MRAAEQAVGPRDQHHRHHQEFGHQRELGEIHADEAEIHHADADADRLDLGDDDGGQVSPGDRAHAADHHHHEGVADRGEIGGEIGRLARHLQRAAEAGERGAEREHGGEQHGLIDAERADHLAVLRRRPHQPAEARAREREMQRQQHHRADKNQEQVVARQLAAEHFDRAAQARRARPEQVFRSPQPERGVVDDQHQREGGEQLEQFGRAINPPQQHDLDQRADDADDKRGGDDAAPEAERAADMGGEGIGDVGPQHIEGPVRDIDDAGDAEDQRQAGGDEETGRTRRTVR